MTDFSSMSQDSPLRAHVSSLPSDYSDVQPTDYDPEYISDISNKMQIPDKIGLSGDSHDNFHNYMEQNHYQSHAMMVPDRIIVAGEGQHIGTREGLRLFDYEKLPQETESNYVGLTTPPRVLTLEETFPTIEPKENNHSLHEQEMSHHEKYQSHNGSYQPALFTPGLSPNDSVLLNEEDESKLLRTQVAKLTRRVTLLEQDNISRSNRDLLLYSMCGGYFFLKMFWWLFKPRS